MPTPQEFGQARCPPHKSFSVFEFFFLANPPGRQDPCPPFFPTPHFLTPYSPLPQSDWQARCLRYSYGLRPRSANTPHSSLLAPHSSLLTPHSSLLTPHSSLP
ncbi:hypothetical protein [Egbenema bharatensis]|uniref:hypothetical protein n=1 Tax=Egbenema bharatensis TaxID=3463334 RepID=UPI003A863508